MAFLTIRGHVCPANPLVLMCRQCPRVSARALAGVPVSYPWRVVSFPNRRALGFGGERLEARHPAVRQL